MAGQSLVRCAPEAVGIPSQAVLQFVNEVEEKISEMHSFMLLRHGKVAAEGWWAPYAPSRRHILFSLTKSFTSTAVGLAVAEGRLSVIDPVVSFFPEYVPADASDNLKNMRVRQLLSMSTGHQEDATGPMIEQGGEDWVKGFFGLPVENKPGTHFVYNSAASYILGAIVQRVTGMTMREYLMPRLFEPLGIEDPEWETCPRGVNLGGWGLSVRTEDIARFGQLYLQKGMWGGKRILPESWVEEATSKQVSNGFSPESDWDQGYGYQFWRCRHNAYRGDGAFGQYCIVMPDQDAVLAITSGVSDMQAVMNLVWDILLPAMGSKKLKSDRSSHTALKRKLAGLAYAPPAGRKSVSTVKRVTGRRFTFEPNEWGLQEGVLEFGANRCVLRILNPAGDHSVTCGLGKWVEGVTTLFSEGEAPVAASAVWSGPHTLTLSLRMYTTPFVHTAVFDFGRKDVALTIHTNVSFSGPVSLEFKARWS